MQRFPSSLVISVNQHSYRARIGLPPPDGFSVEPGMFPACGFRLSEDTTDWSVGDQATIQVVLVNDLRESTTLYCGELGRQSTLTKAAINNCKQARRSQRLNPFSIAILPHHSGGGAKWWLDVVESALSGRFNVRRIAGVSDLEDRHGDGLSRFRTTAAYESAADAGVRVLEDLAPDVLLVNTIEGVAAVDAAIATGVPVMWAIHESYAPGDLWSSVFQGQSHSGAPIRALERCLSGADLVIFSSSATAKLFARYVSSRQQRIVPFVRPLTVPPGERSLRRTEMRDRFRFDAEHVVFVCVATIEERKNTIPLLATFARVAKRCRNARLLLAGPADPTYARLLAETLEFLAIEGTVSLTAAQVDAEDFMLCGDVYVSVSDVEARPTVITQAIQLGMPVVSTLVPGIRELVVDGRNGFILPTGDYGAIEDCLVRLADDEALRARFSDESSRIQYLVLNHRWAEEVVQIATQLTDGRRDPPLGRRQSTDATIDAGEG